MAETEERAGAAPPPEATAAGTDRSFERAKGTVLDRAGGLGEAVSRRALLKGGATGAAAMAVGAMWSPPAFATVGGSGSLKTRPAVLTLVNRLTYGQTEAEYMQARVVGYNQYLATALNPGPINDVAADAFIAPFLGHLNATPYNVLQGNPVFSTVIPVLQQAMLGRGLLSLDQIRQKMVEFWTDHFNIFGFKPGEEFLKQWDDKNVVRAHAMGSFKDLLRASSKSSAMSWYLDQFLSTAPGVNENYARELIELHTLNPEDPCNPGTPNYTEADVLAAAQCLSGFTIDSNANPVNPLTWGLFAFNPAQHFVGPKTFLGKTITQDGLTPAEGEQVVDILADHHLTGRFVAWKLIRRFLRYDPPCTLVDAVSLIYRNTNGSVPAMLAEVLKRPNVNALTSGGTTLLQLRRPYDFVLAVMRAVGHQLGNTAAGPMTELKKMSHAPFEWPAPDGPPVDEEAWVHNVFARWQFATSFFAPQGAAWALDGVHVSDTELLNLLGPVATVADAVRRIDVILTGGVMTDNEACVIEAFINISLASCAPCTTAQVMQILRMAFGLGASGPTFNYH